MKPVSLSDPDSYIELLRRAPMLKALHESPQGRRALEDALEISRATSHRFTTWLGERDLIERIDGEFHLTPLGQTVSDAVTGFKAAITVATRLGPVVDAQGKTSYPVPLDAFSDATVTTPAHSDPYGPMTRYVSLVRETTTLRGFDTWTIAPTYMDEIQSRILGGMETELIDPIPVVEEIMERYPERCVEVCVSGNLTIRLHDDLPFGLAIFDERVGLAVYDPETLGLTAFVDTDSPIVREWATAVYDAYKADSVLLEEFTRTGLRDAVDAMGAESA